MKTIDKIKSEDGQYYDIEASKLKPVGTVEELRTALNEGSTPILLAKGVEYVVDDTPLTLPEKTTVYGNNAILKRADGYLGRVVDMNPHCRLSDVLIIGNRENAIGANIDTVEIGTRRNCVVDNCRIEDGNRPFYVTGNYNVISNCEIIRCSHIAIDLNYCSNSIIKNNYILESTLVPIDPNVSASAYYGAINWGNSCEYISCIDNHIRTSRIAFCGLDHQNSSHARITGNLVEDCDQLMDTIYTPADAPGVMDVVVDGNDFRNCGKLSLVRNAKSGSDPFRFIISNNVFKNTIIACRGAKDVVIEGNLFDTNSSLQFTGCHNFVLSGNVITRNIEAPGALIYGGDEDENSVFSITGNTFKTLSTGTMALHLQAFKRLVFSDNIVEYSLTGESVVPAIKLAEGAICTGNRFSLGGIARGIYVASSCIVKNNTLVCEDANSVAIYGNASVSNTLVINNMTNGTISVNQESGINVVRENVASGELVDQPKASLAYELSADGTYYIVTGRGTVTSSEIVIPDTYQGKPVREIGRNALNHSDIKSITVGGNIVYIAPCFPETLEELYFTMTAEQCYEYAKELYGGDYSFEKFLDDEWGSMSYRATCEEHEDSTYLSVDITGTYLMDYDGSNCVQQYLEATRASCYEWEGQTEEEGAHLLTADQTIIRLAG